MVDQVPPAPWPDLAAGPATAASLCALVAVDAGRLSGAQLADAVACAEKAVSLLLGVQARLLSALAVPFVAGDPDAAGGQAGGQAGRRSGLSDGMDDERAEQIVQAMVPEAAQSLAAGEIAAALRIALCRSGRHELDEPPLSRARAGRRRAGG